MSYTNYDASSMEDMEEHDYHNYDASSMENMVEHDYIDYVTDMENYNEEVDPHSNLFKGNNYKCVGTMYNGSSFSPPMSRRRNTPRAQTHEAPSTSKRRHNTSANLHEPSSRHNKKVLSQQMYTMIRTKDTSCRDDEARRRCPPSHNKDLRRQTPPQDLHRQHKKDIDKSATLRHSSSSSRRRHEKDVHKLPKQREAPSRSRRRHEKDTKKAPNYAKLDAVSDTLTKIWDPSSSSSWSPKKTSPRLPKDLRRHPSTQERQQRKETSNQRRASHQASTPTSITKTVASTYTMVSTSSFNMDKHTPPS